MTSEQMNEIADAPAGAVDKAVRQVRIQQEDPYVRLAAVRAATGTGPASQKMSSKSDADRMGVQGSTPSAQTSKAAAQQAPQIVQAEVAKSPGAKGLEGVSREHGTAADKNVREEKMAKEAATKGTDYV